MLEILLCVYVSVRLEMCEYVCVRVGVCMCVWTFAEKKKRQGFKQS